MADSVWMCGEQHTVPQLLEMRLEASPDSPYLDVCGTAFTAAEVASASNRIGNSLITLGVERGDRVASLVENSPEAMLAWWSAVRASGATASVSTRSAAPTA
jgi:crotonobetaine/carnitine-CoA ligase